MSFGRNTQACIALLALPGTLFGQAASVAFEDSYAVYGANIFPAVTDVQYCAPYRVLTAYINGTDMLFVDELDLAKNQSTFQVLRGVSIREFNAYEESRDIQRIACQIGSHGELQVSGRAYSFHSGRYFDFAITFEEGLGSYSYEGNERE